MAAGTWNFTLEQGVTFVQSLVWTDANNNPVNLTGYTGHMQIRNEAPLIAGNTASLLYIDMTTSGGQINIGGPNGTVTLVLTSTETGILNFTTAVYDLALTSPSGAVTRLLQGTVTLSPEVTI